MYERVTRRPPLSLLCELISVYFSGDSPSEFIEISNHSVYTKYTYSRISRVELNVNSVGSSNPTVVGRINCCLPESRCKTPSSAYRSWCAVCECQFVVKEPAFSWIAYTGLVT